MDQRTEDLLQHIRAFFSGHIVAERRWQLGRIREAAPDLRILEIQPGPRSALWTYISLGAHRVAANREGPLEFFLCAEHSSPRLMRLITMVVDYATHTALAPGHILPIGEPWLEGSSCCDLLLSRAYPFGPELEVFRSGESPVRLLWLLPITRAETSFAKEYGLGALEARFEASKLRYWDAERPSMA